MIKEHFIDKPEYLTLISDIADLMLQKRVGFNYKNFIIEDKEGNESYTPKGQELFEQYLNEIEDLFTLNGVLSLDIGVDDSQINFIPDLELVEKTKPEAKILPFKGQIGAISGDKDE